MSKKYGDDRKEQPEVILSIRAKVIDNALMMRQAGDATAKLEDGTDLEISQLGGVTMVHISAPDKSWRDYTITPNSLAAAVLEAENAQGQKWLFQANSDWTESSLTLYKPETDHDGDGKPYSFRHVFEAPDWDTAKLQIARLRFGADS